MHLNQSNSIYSEKSVSVSEPEDERPTQGLGVHGTPAAQQSQIMNSESDSRKSFIPCIQYSCSLFSGVAFPGVWVEVEGRLRGQGWAGGARALAELG